MHSCIKQAKLHWQAANAALLAPRPRPPAASGPARHHAAQHRQVGQRRRNLLPLHRRLKANVHVHEALKLHAQVQATGQAVGAAHPVSLHSEASAPCNLDRRRRRQQGPKPYRQHAGC